MTSILSLLTRELVSNKYSSNLIYKHLEYLFEEEISTLPLWAVYERCTKEILESLELSVLKTNSYIYNNETIGIYIELILYVQINKSIYSTKIENQIKELLLSLKGISYVYVNYKDFIVNILLGFNNEDINNLKSNSNNISNL